MNAVMSVLYGMLIGWGQGGLKIVTFLYLSREKMDPVQPLIPCNHIIKWKVDLCTTGRNTEEVTISGKGGPLKHHL